jgi:hypothetical protein
MSNAKDKLFWTKSLRNKKTVVSFAKNTVRCVKNNKTSFLINFFREIYTITLWGECFYVLLFYSQNKVFACVLIKFLYNAKTLGAAYLERSRRK